jgi:hypothetical protein
LFVAKVERKTRHGLRRLSSAAGLALAQVWL